MDLVVRRKSIQVIRDSYRVYRTMSGEREFCRNCRIIGPVGDPVMAMSVVEGEGGQAERMHHGERQGYGQGLFEWTRVACMGSVLGFVLRSIPTPMIERDRSDAF